MTDITPLIRRDAQVIQAYATGTIKVSGQVYTTSILVLPTRTLPWSGGYDELLALAGEVELLLVGTGRHAKPMDSEIRARFRELGVGVEVMDTGAACRTFNVLMAEGRKVAAALHVLIA